MTAAPSNDREATFQQECKALESEISDSVKEFRRHKLVHRVVKLTLGWLAVIAGGVATATAFDDNPEVAAWAALLATILVGWQAWQNPVDKEADHQRREAECRHLRRLVRQMRELRRDPATYDARIKELAERSAELRTICERPWVK